MSAIVAQSHHIFGLRSQVINNICYFDEQTVIFPSGNNCVKYNVDQKWQKFIPGSEKGQGMQALAISPNHRYLAMSEKSSDKATITIYDLASVPFKKRKVLSAPDFLSQAFVSLSFSPDSKYLVAQSGAPEWQIIFWMWEKQKVMATVKADSQNNPIYQVSFNPNDNTQICVTGHGVFKLFRYVEGNLRQTNFQKVEPQNFLCHAWLSEDRVICGTDTGRLCLWESGDLRWEQNIAGRGVPQPQSDKRGESSEDGRTFSAIDSASSSPVRVNAILAYSKGFLCSGGPGKVCMYDKVEDRELYKRVRNIKIPPDERSNDPGLSDQQEVLCMCLSPSEETVLVSTNKSQLYSIALSSAEISKGDDAVFEFLTESWHSSSITGLSICIRKPLIATCSLDRSVRIWSYENNTLELYKDYQEEAFSVSLHPSGLHVLVGFSDKLRLMNLLIDDIRPFKDFTVRGCRECAFSHGGHLFAAVNGNVIHIYSTTTFENTANLKGHNGKVRSVAWSADDSKLVSCGLDGAVYEWNTLTGKRESECVLKSCSYSCITLLADSKTIFAVGSDQTLKEISDSQIVREVPSFDVTYTAVAISHSGKMIFTGTSVGTVRSMKYPLPPQREYNEYQGHAGPVTKLMVTYDDQYLLSVSEDGCLMLWKISDKEGRGLKRDKEMGYAEEVLITKSDLEEKNQVMLELKTRVEELKMENEYQLRLKDMNYNEKLKELTEKFIQEMEVLKTTNQILKAEAEKQELKHQENVAEIIEKHSQMMQDLETANNQKLLLEYEKYQELQMKSQHMQEEDERQLHELEESKSQALEELTEYYETKLHEKVSQLQQAQDEARQHHREFEETKKQIEEDGDREIQDVKIKYERRLREEKETVLRLKGENGIMRKKFSSLQKDIEERAADIEKMRLEQQKLQAVIKSLEKDIQGLKREIHERDETIQDKEKRIYDLKKKNQELEKFKFVLDYKIKELKKQIEPRENEIKDMKEQIQEMEAELERFHKQNTQLDLNITELKQKLKATEREMQRERQKVRDVEALVKRFKTDMHNCVGFIQEPKKLKDTIRELYSKYVQESDVAEIVGIDADIQREYARQREHLERSLSTLQKKLVKDTEIHRVDNVRIMQENVTLIKEINELRRELKVSRTKVHDLEVALRLDQKNRRSSLTDSKATSVADHHSSGVLRLNIDEETARIIDMQKIEIKRLRDLIQSQDLTAGMRPPSVGRLPSLTAS
ncbi:PREDICTED: cilia- and flagella-associated protein 57 isoform X1 [Nanorana parkeri]|uniref:cilia- and flagella-associated protein 57 isoform X1 n=1 Tax=Nanorana parkeri TaxID=125878 RepID=UPI000854AF2E|nr:PREDICTED: cilia- and flagella-associated protein 57 isoform X1 [Nanorana parkeri]